MPEDLCYSGPYRLEDALPGSKHLSVGSALLSPTRTYAPLIDAILKAHRPKITALIHCSGGGQTKCLKFAHNTHITKDNLFEPPPIFAAIETASKTPQKEMYQVFNMGHRMEVYTDPTTADAVITIAESFGIDAKIIGRTEPAKANRLTLITPSGETILY